MNWREVCAQRSGPVNGLLNAPLPFFDTVHQDHQLGNITDVTNFHKDAKAGTLPNVTWITPSGPNSEHPPSKVGDGQAWTHQPDQRRHAGPRVEQHRDLPLLG